MHCSRCEKEIYPLAYVPTPVSIVARQAKYGEWVCPNCLTDEEAGGPEARIRGVLRANLNYPPPPKTIPREEYLYALKAADFRCPKKRRPESCEGHSCPLRPDRLRFLDYYGECVRSLRARMLVTDVMEGKVLLDRGIGGWEVELT